MQYLINHQLSLRLSFALGGLILFFALGLIFPYRKDPLLTNPKRWLVNISLSFGNGLIVALLLPLTLIEIAATETIATQYNLWQLHPLISFITGVFILDLALYWQHRLTHKIPVLWRLHRMHHSDPEFDATTAGRFHTLEILLSFLFKAIVILLFGIPIAAVILFEILLNFSSLFNHSNFHFPDKIEKILRLVIITPDLHRIHHSVEYEEMNSNFGFSISLWDRLFTSYRAHSQKDQVLMTIGLKKFRKKSDQSLLSLLKQPIK